MTPEPFEILLHEGAVIRGDVWIPAAFEEDAAIAVCHGFKGFKDWGFFPLLCEELAGQTGCVTVCFNFTGSGIGERPEEFTELEAFGRNTLSRELEDLEIVLDGLTAGRLGRVELPPARRFGLLGHSRGGATAILKASRRTQVRGLATWAAVASVRRYIDPYSERFAAGGTVYIENTRTGQMMPLHRNVLDDLRAHPHRLDVTAAAARVRVPFLIVHGTDDESVPVADAETLAAAAGPAARMELIEGAGHTFGAAHPFAGSNPDLDRAIESSAAHLRRTLREERSP